MFHLLDIVQDKGIKFMSDLVCSSAFLHRRAVGDLPLLQNLQILEYQQGIYPMFIHLL